MERLLLPKMLFSLFVQLILFHGLLAHAQSSSMLGYTPLAVKTPYLHAWISSNLNGNSDGVQSPAGIWPNFVSADRILGWAGMIRVDGQGYQWMGENALGINFTKTVAGGIQVTPTKSIFTIEAGHIRFNVTYLSPIEPSDYVRQSMPFSYVYIDGIVADDSQPHNVQVYSDISSEWVTRDDTQIVVWNTTDQSDAIVYHRVARQSLSPMEESNGISEDATAYYAMAKHPNLTWQTGEDQLCRKNFTTNGNLPNTGDSNFRAVADRWPVFSLSVDLGTISPGDRPDPVVWALGLVRDPLVNYTVDGSAQSRTAYYWSNYANIDEVMTAFLGDFTDAVSRSLALDNKVLSAAATISSEYGDILSLVTRQIFASMDITIPSAQSGQFNSSDVKIFMKDIGQSRRTNAVEVIYGALPALLFFNSSLVHDLLQPLLEFQSSPQYPNPEAAPDLGMSYPLAHGNSTGPHKLAVENCGNMLIMAYAHSTISGDNTLLSRYYSVLQRWADFLIGNSVHPNGFITADGLNNQNMSNLAVKGILGVYSMAKITEAVGMPNTTYMDQATQLIDQWNQSAIAADGHIQAVYGQAEAQSWGLMYNLFPAVWLNTSLVEDSVLEHQAQFYIKQTPQKFGYNLDNSRPDTAYPHWTLMTAATIPGNLNGIRDQLIDTIHQRAYLPNDNSPLPVTYSLSTGKSILGNGSPILGAAFAVMAVQHQTAPPPGSPSQSPHKKDTGAIVGGVLGSLAFLLLVAAAAFIFRRKHKNRQGERRHEVDPFTVTNNTNTNSNMAQVSHQENVGSQRASDGPGSFRSLSPQGVVGPPAMSRKQREALGPSRQRLSMQSETPLLASSGSHLPSASGTEDLRVEVEQLRREMESYRYPTDAPPEYT